jgi:hypothetical protein
VKMKENTRSSYLAHWSSETSPYASQIGLLAVEGRKCEGLA